MITTRIRIINETIDIQMIINDDEIDDINDKSD